MNLSDNDRFYGSFTQAIMMMCPADFIGYSASEIKHFKEGFRWAVERAYMIESQMVGDSIVAELGMQS
jgi:hypothetical protein